MIAEFRNALDTYKKLSEELQLHRRDLYSRLNRKLREKLSPPVRDLLPARRERQQRNRKHRFASLGPQYSNIQLQPLNKRLSSWLRFR